MAMVPGPAVPGSASGTNAMFGVCRCCASAAASDSSAAGDAQARDRDTEGVHDPRARVIGHQHDADDIEGGLGNLAFTLFVGDLLAKGQQQRHGSQRIGQRQHQRQTKADQLAQLDQVINHGTHNKNWRAPQRAACLVQRFNRVMHSTLHTSRQTLTLIPKPLLGALLALAPLAQPTLAAGMICAQAMTPTELAICADADLLRQDSELSAAYGKLGAARPDGREALRQDQRDWLRARRRCGAQASCIRDQYLLRLSALQDMLRSATAYVPDETDRLALEDLRQAVEAASRTNAEFPVEDTPPASTPAARTASRPTP
ncbi:hypothetical protein G6F65_016149 [Rhizopus arrhizus]|nr:hypothetical protein G6F65_016149 [Rhizopus arrhizus]